MSFCAILNNLKKEVSGIQRCYLECHHWNKGNSLNIRTSRSLNSEMLCNLSKITSNFHSTELGLECRAGGDPRSLPWPGAKDADPVPALDLREHCRLDVGCTNKWKPR